MNPPHPFLHLHQRQTPSDTTIDTSVPQSPTDNSSNSSSFYHPHHSSVSSIYLAPIVADRTILTNPRTISASSFGEQQHHPSSTPSLPYTTTITPLFRPTPPTTHSRVSAIITTAATLSAITANSTEAAALTSNNNNAVRKSFPSPVCETCMASTSVYRRQRAASPHSTRLPSPRHQQQQRAAATHPSVITPEFDIVHHPIRDTVWIVSVLLSLMAHKNDEQYNPLVDPITPFHSRAVPRISIEAYLTRILQFIPFTNEVLLNVLVFLDRIGGLGGMENEIVGLMEGCGTGRNSDSTGGSSNHVDVSLQKNGYAADAVAASSSSRPCSLSSHPSTALPSDTITSSPPFSTGTATASSTQITTKTSATALPGSTSGQAQSSRCHTCRHTQRVCSMSSSSSSSGSSRVEYSSCSRVFSASASNEADPDSFPPSSTSPASSPSSSATSCIHPASNNNNSYNSNSNNNILSSDPPMIHKRGREAEIHEHEQRSVGGGCAGCAGGSRYPPESWTSSLSSSSTSPSSFSSSSTETTPPRPVSTHQHPSPPSFHGGDSNRDIERLAKRARFQGPVATERVITSSTTANAHITPGGVTPAPTPKMTAAPNGFRVNSFNIHRLLITCLMVAAKFTSDLFYSNARYAKVGGLSLPELNQLELVLLFTTQFDLNVKEEELQRVGNTLLRFKNRETTTSDSQVSLPAPPAAIAAQVSRTVVVVSNNTIHPNTINTVANTNAANDDGHHVLQTNTTATTESSSEVIVDPCQQPPRVGRFSIPSPTSPKNEPMSDRGFLKKLITSLPSSTTSSSPSSSSTSTVSPTAAATLHAVSSSAGHSTTVVASGSRSQPPQLLSPPEEKCGGWAGGGIGEDSHDVHMATPAPTPSALSSSMPTEPS